MRHMSERTAARKAEESAFKRELFDELGACEICGHDPTLGSRGNMAWRMELHHIARGIHREKARVERCAVLLLCWRCHQLAVHGNADWPQWRQLAMLKQSRPGDYDLAAFNALVGWGKNRITKEEVDNADIE